MLPPERTATAGASKSSRGVEPRRRRSRPRARRRACCVPEGAAAPRERLLADRDASRRRSAATAWNGDVAGAADRDAVGHRRHRLERDGLPGGERGGVRGGVLGLHADDADVRASGFTAVATPARSPPPPDGTTMVPRPGTCSRISRPQVPWPATMSRWSKGWISTAPVSSANAGASSSASSTVCAVEADLGAVAAGGLLLGDRRALGHEHGGVDAEHLRGERDALRVVAGAGGDDAVGPLLRRRAGDPHVGAADLERTGALQVLGLDQHRSAGERGEPPRRLHRGVDRDPVERLAGGADVLEGRQGHVGHALTLGPRCRPPGVTSGSPFDTVVGGQGGDVAGVTRVARRKHV